MEYKDTHSRSDPHTVPLGEDLRRDGLKPDITTYDPEWCPTSNTPDLTLADSAHEFKPNITYDPFDDGGKHDSRDKRFPFEAQTVDGRATRSQICSYASAIFQLQFRFFFFSILIMRTHARFIRWERAGAVVSEAFEINSSSLLSEFIWRYSFMTRAQRGFDCSILRCSATESKRVEKARQMIIDEEEKRNPETAKIRSARKAYFLKMLPSTPPHGENTAARYPRNSRPAPDGVSFSADTEGGDKGNHDGGDEKSSYPFLILTPLYIYDRSPFAKGTRSFIVCHLPTKQLFHLKDTYRVSTPAYVPEHDILEELRKNKVLRVPTVFCAWDVAPYGECYDTIFGTMFARFNTGNHKSEDDRTVWAAKRVLRPYRLITREIARESKAFQSWREESVVMYDVLGGMPNLFRSTDWLMDVSRGAGNPCRTLTVL